MEGLREDAQWIVLMGFIVSFSLFFLAVVINQSTVIGQTTAESVSEFPKDEIRSVRGVIIQDAFLDDTGPNSAKKNVDHDIRVLSLSRMNAVVDFRDGSYSSSTETFRQGEIRFNNGVTLYRETWTYHE